MFTTISNILKWAYVFFISLLHRITKVFLRKVTRLTELQRIIYGELQGCRRFRKVEASLNGSRNPEIRRALAELDRGLEDGRFRSRGTRKALLTTCAAQITKAKNINLKLHARFVKALTESLEVIYATKSLNVRVNLLRETEYSTKNLEHETKLLELWDNMMSGETLSARKTRQWQELGFQGTDPATDFRGAGLLALETLLYISKAYPEVAKRLLENSHHPRYSYPLALLVIQIAYLGCQLCEQGPAKTHFYNRFPTILTLDDAGGPADTALWDKELLNLFHELCTSLVIDFDALWMSSKPKDIMEYSRIKTIFDTAVLRKLQNDETCFLMEVRTI